MGATRQGYDLLKSHGWGAFFSSIRRGGVSWDHVWMDTFGKMFCFFLGHRQDTWWGVNDDWKTYREICRRCNKRTGRAKMGSPGIFDIR